MGTYKVRGGPPYNALKFFARGDPSKYT